LTADGRPATGGQRRPGPELESPVLHQDIPPGREATGRIVRHPVILSARAARGQYRTARKGTLRD